MSYPALHEDEGDHQKQVGELIKQTATSMDDLALKMLFVTVQQNNLEACIEYAVHPYVVHSSGVFSAHRLLRGIFERINTMVIFDMNARHVTIEINEVGIDIPDRKLVWTLLLDGM